jgi:hypothetical protein
LRSSSNLKDISILFGTGKNLKRFSIKGTCESLGPEKSLALTGFYCASGTDINATFTGKGKKSVWNTWKIAPFITPVFKTMFENPFMNIDTNSDTFKKLQRFVCLIYSSSTPLEKVNELRLDIYSHRNATMEALPPTENALLQHCKRAIYQ